MTVKKKQAQVLAALSAKKKRRSYGGYRDDLGFYVRSIWEANFARVCVFLKETGQIYDFAYEPDEFQFHKIKRGTRFYKPDFKIWDHADAPPRYVEVKGWMDATSKTKLSRMARYYPDVQVDLVTEKEMRHYAKLFAHTLPNWE